MWAFGTICDYLDDIDTLYSGRPAFDKIIGYIQKAKEAGAEVLTGGTCESLWFLTKMLFTPKLITLSGDDSKGFYVQPTILLTKDPKSITMVQEIFGPVLTVYVYEDADWDKTLTLVDTTSDYGLTGSM